MKVLIVSKTHKAHDECVDGLDYGTGQDVRLMTRTGENQPNNKLYEVGQIWDIGFNSQDGTCSNADYQCDAHYVD